MTYLMLLLVPLFTADDKVDRATLGVETRQPSADEAEKHDLPKGVRVAGRIVTSVEEDGPADKAGIKKGDVILKLDKNVFHSDDSMQDFLRVTEPGKKVVVTIKRKKKEMKLKVTLGKKEVEKKGITWEFAGLEQLDAAIKEAKKRETLVLVGVSGCET